MRLAREEALELFRSDDLIGVGQAGCNSRAGNSSATSAQALTSGLTARTREA